MWRLRPGTDVALTEQLHELPRAHAVDLGAGDLAPLCEADA
jgi:nitrilase